MRDETKMDVSSIIKDDFVSDIPNKEIYVTIDIWKFWFMEKVDAGGVCKKWAIKRNCR